jgi:hypothetical protein
MGSSALFTLDSSQRCHRQAESKVRRPSTAPFDLTAKRLHDISGRRERLLSCGYSSFASKILCQSPGDPGFRQGDLHPFAARRLLVLQARQLPCTSVDRHPQAPPYYQVMEWSHYALALGWMASPRIWADVMNVVNCALKSQGIRTILYVDDLLVGCGNQQEAFMAREIIALTLSESGISRSPTKGQWEPSQVLLDHLGNTISSK